ncbi:MULTISPECIES: helix-turn-helix domain-containing protein [Chryseobacterium]|uniref:Helix-turn-helix domain-containing protein n=1 Tax=Chryseobacterium nepalense TaxID=1854498 RepID=A0ABY4K9R4_9FLAO|nr:MULTISPECIES: helix-turn-helix transcriptional regulator [Chryseobacterium]MEA1849071.1 helix-turn-helix transcriptional regulator [Chryseobacterium sp. MHB01]UPQ77536.1 helix-turn-helix domain-containing protein [Chryseobacterium nepalense]
MMSLGTKVRQYREAKRLSQDDLALRLDVTQSTISNIESDKSIPNSMLLKKIADELEVDINDLLNDSVNNIMSNNDFSDHAVAAVNQYNPVFNMQSLELIESILKTRNR